MLSPLVRKIHHVTACCKFHRRAEQKLWMAMTSTVTAAGIFSAWPHEILVACQRVDLSPLEKMSTGVLETGKGVLTALILESSMMIQFPMEQMQA